MRGVWNQSEEWKGTQCDSLNYCTSYWYMLCNPFLYMKHLTNTSLVSRLSMILGTTIDGSRVSSFLIFSRDSLLHLGEFLTMSFKRQEGKKHCGFQTTIAFFSMKYNLCLILLMAEIRRSPVEVGSFSHYLQGFSTIPGGAGFLPSTEASLITTPSV